METMRLHQRVVTTPFPSVVLLPVPISMETSAMTQSPLMEVLLLAPFMAARVQIQSGSKMVLPLPL